MSEKKAKSIVEAILFTMGRAVKAADIAAAADIEEETVKNAARDLMRSYQEDNRGIRIIELDDSFQMCTDPSMYDYINAFTHQPKKYQLTNVMLETLAIIAYRQPVTRAEIEKIRGVNCSHPVNKLLEYGLIMEAGRLNAPGRPILFSTTEEFLRAFGVSSRDDLPEVPEQDMDRFQREAQEEANETVDV